MNLKDTPHDGRLLRNEGFDFTAPRPPVPGRERHQTVQEASHYGSSSAPHYQALDWKQQQQQQQIRANPPGGYEPEGYRRPSSRGEAEHHQQPSPPPCLRWTRSLHALLQDPDGVELFRAYLETEGPKHAEPLDFWFACEGLRKQVSGEKIHQLVKVIYKKFFVKSMLPIGEELRQEIGQSVKLRGCLEPPVTLFDRAQAQVEQVIQATTYPNFLKSDLFLHHLESAQQSSSSGSELSSNEQVNYVPSSDLLPTVHEDMELVVNHPPSGHVTPNPQSAGAVRLTKDLLLMSQKHRAVDVRPKSEAYASMYMNRGGNAHAAYNSYNPVSRQDSEMQSVSSHSDARTESDNMSITSSPIDGRSIGKTSRRQIILEKRQARESAALNRETHLNQTFIPRTQRLEGRQLQPMRPETFAAILTEKLDLVKRERDTQELLERKLKETLTVEDDDQDILDQHVSRVFSDLTPARTPPGGGSPSASPPRNRHVTDRIAAATSYRQRRRDRDGYSTFSGDSGNVHDYRSESAMGGGCGATSLSSTSSQQQLQMVKSKSMPEYGGAAVSREEERFSRGASCRRTSSRRALTELTDSGVSVVSDTPPMVLQAAGGKDSRVMAWLLDSDKSGGRGGGTTYTHSEMSRRSHRSSATSPSSSSRHRRNYAGSRSSSVERASGSSVGGREAPAQPFVADPNMPPLPIPNTAVQLEEARRRLEDDVNRSKKRVSGVGGVASMGSARYYGDGGVSAQSTLRKVAPAPAAKPGKLEEVTTVVFSFCDEQFPYRTKIPGTQVTLRQFKEYLPKKGNYRFFFKTVCEELDNQVIHEEVSNDADVLPLWEGKIMAQVKPLD